jgi:hypothetical protein
MYMCHLDGLEEGHSQLMEPRLDPLFFIPRLQPHPTLAHGPWFLRSATQGQARHTQLAAGQLVHTQNEHQHHLESNAAAVGDRDGRPKGKLIAYLDTQAAGAGCRLLPTVDPPPVFVQKPIKKTLRLVLSASLSISLSFSNSARQEHSRSAALHNRITIEVTQSSCLI